MSVGAPAPAREARESPAAPRRSRVALIGLTWVLVAVALQLLRQRGAPIYDTIWAEDGALFLEDALRDPASSFLETAGGYLHSVPRILAGLAALLPLRWAAVVIGVGAAAVVAALSLYAFHALRDLVPGVFARASIAGVFALAPASWWESVGNAATLQYAFVFGSFAALVHRPRSRLGAIAGGVIALLGGLSTSVSLILVPLGLWVLIRERFRFRSVILGGFFLGVAGQSIALVAAIVLGLDPTLAQYPIAWESSDPLTLAPLFGMRVAGQLLVGDQLADNVWRLFGDAFGWAALIVLTSGAFILFLAARKRARAWVLALGALAGAAFAMPALARGTAHFEPVAGVYNYAGNRFVLVPTLLLVTAGFVALSDSRWRGGIARTARATLSAYLLVLVAINFSFTNVRSLGPRWERELTLGRLRCQVLPAEEVEVPITPNIGPGGWLIRVPCDEV